MAVVKKNNRVPNLDRVFFWDFDIDAMDFEKAYKTIIARIIERGGQYEIDEIMHFYGHEKVIRIFVTKSISFPIMPLTVL